MKIDRLIGILCLLLQQGKVTVPALAERFEVSCRTIHRDIAGLCQAGIPLVTAQGKGGGVSILEGYTIERGLLSGGELQSILTGLKSLDSVSGGNRYQQLMDKLSPGDGEDSPILIDLASYSKAAIAPKIEQVRQAILARQLLQFDYYGPTGEGPRTIEPYLLVFQWSAWYVWGFCLDRQDFRLFKLNRLLRPVLLPRGFVPREHPPYRVEQAEAFPTRFEVLALFERGMRWRLIEEYGADSFVERKDGKLLFRFGFTDEDHTLRWLLTFGDQVVLLEPKELRPRLQALAGRVYALYNNPE